MTDTFNHAPNGMHTVTPHLVCAGAADAIEFYKKAFGAVELMRLAAPHGKILHACIKIGDSSVMLVDEMEECQGSQSPKALKGTPVTLHLYVENADSFIEKAVAAGATMVLPPEDMFWGDRYGIVEDPFGHHWSIAHHQRDLTQEEIQQAAEKLFG